MLADGSVNIDEHQRWAEGGPDLMALDQTGEETVVVRENSLNPTIISE